MLILIYQTAYPLLKNILSEDIKKRLSKCTEENLSRKNNGGGRVMNGQQDYLQMGGGHRKGSVLDCTT